MDRVVVSDDKCFTVRYTVKPEAIGCVDYDLDQDAGSYILRNGQNELRGTSNPAKDVEAVLLWDNAQQAYVLHQVSENMRVAKVQKHRQQPKNSVFRSRVATPQVIHTPPAVSESERESMEPEVVKIEPKIEPKVEPKAEPKVEPKAEPEPEPEVDLSEDDFGDLATELAGELRKAESEEEESEEE